MPKPFLNPAFAPSIGRWTARETSPISRGITVADIVVDGSITVQDGSALPKAIAIETFNFNLGLWQYSTDGGVNWLNAELFHLGTSAQPRALVLGPQDRLRLLRSDTSVDGDYTDALVFRAFDLGNGSSGQFVDIRPDDPEFSTEQDTVAITLAADTVNHAPLSAPVRGGGTAIFALGSGADVAAFVLELADSGILLAGRSGSGARDDLAMVRLLSDGTPDTNFGSSSSALIPVASSDFVGSSYKLQPDGRLLVAGTFWNSADATTDYGLWRLNSDGSLDASFGNGGIVTVEASRTFNDETTSIALQADGRILVAGFSDVFGGRRHFSVIRLNSDGTLDPTFSGDGLLVQPVGGDLDRGYTVAVQADGRILVAGQSVIQSVSQFSLIRLLGNGVLDPDFDVDGKLAFPIGTIFDRAYTVLPQSDGSILMGGLVRVGATDCPALVRLNADGSFDTDFGVGGKVVVPVGSGESYTGRFAVQPDGKIIFWGNALDADDVPSFSILRLTAEGAPDMDFGTAGKVFLRVGPGWSFATNASVQADGKILVAGGSGWYPTIDFAVARLNPDGSLDTSFNPPPPFLAVSPARFVEDGAAVLLEPTHTFYDEDMAVLAAGEGNYAGARISIARSTGANAEDFFSGLGNLTFGANGQLVVSSIVVGHYTQDAGTLYLEFNAQTTQARLDAVIASIGYQNTSDTPPPQVEILWLFSDGNTGDQGTGASLSAEHRSVVLITPVNDAPVVVTPIPNQTTTHDQVFVFQLAANTFADPDQTDLLTLSASRADGGVLPVWLNFDAATGRFSGTPPASAAGVLEIRVTATDGEGAAVSDLFTLTIQDRAGPTGWAFSLAPEAAERSRALGKGENLGTVTATGDPNSTVFTYQFAADAAGNGASATREGLRIDAATGRITTTRTLEDSVTVWLLMRDQAGNTSTKPFVLKVGDKGSDKLTAAAGGSVIFGLGDDDRLNGGVGRDALSGGAGDDHLQGGRGADQLDGGTGSDHLSGGSGRDTFVFAAGDSPWRSQGPETILDFAKGAVGIGDLIDFSVALTPGGSAAEATVSQASINPDTGIAQFAAGSGTTLEDALRDIAGRFSAGGDAAGEFAFFRTRHASSYSLFISDGVAGVGSGDVVVTLMGVTSVQAIDLTKGNLAILA